MNIIISNSFSINMLSSSCKISFNKISLQEVKELLKNNNFISSVGHKSTSELFSQLLQMDIPFNRIEIKLNPENILIIGQLHTRIEEGKILSKEELEVLNITWWKIMIIE